MEITIGLVYIYFLSGYKMDEELKEQYLYYQLELLMKIMIGLAVWHNKCDGNLLVSV